MIIIYLKKKKDNIQHFEFNAYRHKMRHQMDKLAD